MKLFRRATNGTPITHDYTARTWGHNYNILHIYAGGATIQLAGWGTGIRNGDYLLLQQEHGSTRYRVRTIEYKRDPVDMWFATVKFAPRNPG